MACIAMLGYGVVGSGVAQLIMKNKDKFKKTLNEDLTISKILVRNLDKYKDEENNKLLTNNIEDIFKAKVDIVVEAMGGLNPSYEYVKRALNMKKHVVTANKDLIAEYGAELLKIAEENGVTLHFEASVGGGIPILKPLNECLVGNEIKGIKAILNGTTNFILSKMSNENMEYEEALTLAQKLGFAEANADSDVLGLDAARKLSILSTIAYEKRVNWKEINTKGINNIDARDFKYANMEGCTIKLLGISKKENDKVYASVMPIMVNKESALGKVENEYNAILVDGDAVGDVMFSGKGAGMFPTASAVFGDIVDVIGKNEKSFIFNNEKASVNKFWGGESRWLLRVPTEDRLNIIGHLSNAFKSCYIVSNTYSGNEEVAAFVKVDNEEILDKEISFISSLKGVKDVKRILIMN